MPFPEEWGLQLSAPTDKAFPLWRQAALPVKGKWLTHSIHLPHTGMMTCGSGLYVRYAQIANRKEEYGYFAARWLMNFGGSVGCKPDCGPAASKDSVPEQLNTPSWRRICRCKKSPMIGKTWHGFISMSLGCRARPTGYTIMMPLA